MEKFKSFIQKNCTILSGFIGFALLVILLIVFEPNKNIEVLSNTASPYIFTSSPESIRPSDSPVLHERKIVVYVAGKVLNPDIYYLDDGSIANDAIVAAGGFTDDADTVCVNLAQILHDNDMILISAKGGSDFTGGIFGDNNSGTDITDFTVNINTATELQLVLLPGIGSSIAAQIISYRKNNGPFENTEEIMEVPGIGESKYKAIEDYITVR